MGGERVQPRPDPHRRNPRAAAVAHFEKVISDEARFIRKWLDNPIGVGAVSPSGRFLARMMARYVDPAGTGPVIELGPGTGPVTEALLQRGIAPGRLILIEFAPEFCGLLRRRFPGVTVLQGDAYALADTVAGLLREPAAATVSSLPLLTRPEQARIGLLSDAFDLMVPNGPFIQFTYGVVSPVPRTALDMASEVSPPVWLNLPPARVWVYRRSATPRRQAADGMLDRLKDRTRIVRRRLVRQTVRVRRRLRDM